MSTESEIPKDEPKNDWTVMFFFAGDNNLSPSMITQLKAIKDAGFQKNTTVLMYFDPNERGSRVSIFEVNRKRKLEKVDPDGKKLEGAIIGDGKDSFVRNLTEDNIDASKGANVKANAAEALQTFLDYGLVRSAKHYLIFLVGHGMIVGNDAFLPDARPDSAISLEQLGDILGDFSRNAKAQGGTVELIGLHSCSLSGVEVAYQLKGKAKYMMATEAVAFVSSWPYRQLMKRILHTIDEAQKKKAQVDTEQLVRNIQSLAFQNSTDFMFSGLSADLCLTSLDPAKIDGLTAPIKKLTDALKGGLNDKRGLEIIKLAHLKAQSYFQETYTDLFDFCFCVQEQIHKDGSYKDGGVNEAMFNACRALRNKLDESNKGVIVESARFGPDFQYSHGLSVYFPWSAPIEDEFDDILGRYRKYEFTRALGEDQSWLSFLEQYFQKTLRPSREEEDKKEFDATVNGTKSHGRAVLGALAGLSFNVVEASSGGTGGEDLPGDAGDKISPSLGIGSCRCSVKNYPRDFVVTPENPWKPNIPVTNGAGEKTAVAKARW